MATTLSQDENIRCVYMQVRRARLLLVGLWPLAVGCFGLDVMVLWVYSIRQPGS